nr:ParB/RepB/Spo0J family partition protein [uncultured Ralstonia sp.]
MKEVAVQSINTAVIPGAVALAAVASQPVEMVAVTRLALSPYNVRRKTPTGIEALAELIAAKGVMQNLIVHEIKSPKNKTVKLGVCAGQRRMLALQYLLAKGRIAEDYLVPVQIQSEGEALSLSLIENKEREAMHPADQSVAFQHLVQEGKTIPFIAAFFSISEAAVRRELKLASVSPKLLDLFRDNEMTYEQVTALALTEDHAMQERLWFEAEQDWMRNPDQLRQAITGAELDTRRSPFVAYVTLEAYEAAGGYVRRDLFSNVANAGYISDIELLNRLVADKLQGLAQEVAAEGWAWVEVRPKRDHTEMARFGRLHPTRREYTKKEKAEARKLEKAQNEADAAVNAYCDEGHEEDEAYAQLEEVAVQAEKAMLDYSARLLSWEDEQKGRSGVIVSLNHLGQPKIERGLVRPTEKAAVKQDGVKGAEALTIAPEKVKPVHGESLCRRLTAHRTAAVQAELMKQPTVALALVMHKLIPEVFSDVYEPWLRKSALELSATCAHRKLLQLADDMEASTAWQAIDAERQKWAAMLPQRYRDLLPWLLSQSEDVMANLFAFCVAATVDGVSETDSPHVVNAVSDVLEIDMSQYWQATRASYLQHVPKQRIVDVVAQAVSPQAANPLGAMKKGDAAAAAELMLAETKWLPEVLTNRAQPPCLYDDDGDEENAV